MAVMTSFHREKCCHLVTDTQHVRGAYAAASFSS